MKSEIKSEIVADSINSCDCRLTSFVLTFPRIILAELNTHRALSKNSASSRAIPFKKMVKMVNEDPFIPTKFQKDHKGMQGTEYFEGEEHEQCVYDWLTARDRAVESALDFEHPVTKQLRNRLLEPFMWHRVLLSGTEFGNLFRLRAHGDAEIHFSELADKMLLTYNASSPKLLKHGEYHLPFGDKIDDDRVKELSQRVDLSPEDVKKRIITARCARISYNNFEGKDDYDADLRLFEGLVMNIPRHLSPTEHVAMALDSDEKIGNFSGFRQLRKTFADENLTDDRIITKK